MSSLARRHRLTAVLIAVLVGGAGVGGVADVASGQSESETLYVDSTPATSCWPENTTADRKYRTIQGAVDAANAGDTVVVCGSSNLYEGGVTVDEPLTIEGDTSSGPVILSDGTSTEAITVGTSADGTVIRGLTVRGFRSAGVTVESASDVTVANTTFDDIDGPALDLANADGALVDDVEVRDVGAGVVLAVDAGRAVSDVTVRDTTVREAADGVRIRVSGDGTELSGLALSGLALSGSDRGVGVVASGGAVVTDVTVENSTVSAGERGVEVSAADGTPRVEGVTLRGLTVEGPGGVGVSLSARGDGLLRGLALRDSTITSHEVGVSLVDEAALEDVTVFRNRIADSGTGVRVDGEDTPFGNVSVRQNLLERSGEAGVLVTEGTDPRQVDVTRNFLRENGVGVVNDGDGTLTAWLNHWGDDSGPSAGQVSGAGDVDVDPWLGQGACSASGLRSVAEGPFELYGTQVGLAELQSFCAWDLAPLALRPDPADAATSTENLNLSYDLPGTDGPVPADRPAVAIYERGEAFDLQFGAGSTFAGRFADEETQLIVLRDRERANASFDVGFDDRAGETVLRSDADSATVREDWGEIGDDGQLSGTFEPPLPGSYTFVLVTSDFGPGVAEVDGASEVRIDGGATVVGVETVVVRETGAAADTGGAVHSAGDDVSFDLDSNLGDGPIDHAVLLYDEPRFRNATTTVRPDAPTADLIAGRAGPADVSVESSISDLRGSYRGAGGFSALGVDVAAGDGSGRVDPSPFLGLGTRLYDTGAADPADAPGASPLNGSVVVVESAGADTTVDVETFESFPPGTYRYVYVAERGRTSEASSATGRIELTTPTPTPTATPETPTMTPETPTPTPTATPETPTPTPTATPSSGGGGGGGGGGQLGADPIGEVEVENATLLNGTVTTEEPAVVRVDLTNFDPYQGTIDLALAADGEVVAERTVTVGVSSRRTVYLRTIFDEPGTYALALDGTDLGSLTVTRAATPTEAPTPTPSSPTPTAGTDTSTPTPTPTAGTGPKTEDTAAPTTTEAAGIGPAPATVTEAAIALGMSLLLLYGVGVAVYVLREYPP